MEMHQMDDYIAAVERKIERRINIVGGIIHAVIAALLLIAIAERLWVTAAIIVGFLVLIWWPRSRPEQDEITGQQIAERLGRYDYRSGTFRD